MFVDPTGHIKEDYYEAKKALDITTRLRAKYNVNIVVDWGYFGNGALQALVPNYLPGTPIECRHINFGWNWQNGWWTIDQLNIVESTFNIIRDRLRVPESTVARILGSTTILRVGQWDLTTKAIASASPTGSGLVRMGPRAFNAVNGYQEWYLTHELGYVFDFEGTGGDSSKYKSQKFLDEFQTCSLLERLLNGGTCPYDSDHPYNPLNDPLTTDYGKKSVLEDFADTFTVTILFNHRLNTLQSQKRIDIMNDLLSKAVNGK